jgi:membrane protein YdbS with pleckstrin-like domain
MVDTAVSSLKRQLKYLAIPVVLSSCFIFGLIAAFVGAFFGIAGVLGIGFVLFLMLPVLIMGPYFFKRRLYQFPSREVLRDVLEQEGFSVSPNPIL